MNFTAIIGVVVGLTVVCLPQLIVGSSLAGLLDFLVLLIVVGGSGAAIMVQTPNYALRRAMQMVRWSYATPELKFEPLIAQVITWRKTISKKGLLSIENSISQFNDPFLNKGVELVLSGLKQNSCMKSWNMKLTVSSLMILMLPKFMSL